MSQVAHISDCPETLEEAREIIRSQGERLVALNAFRNTVRSLHAFPYVDIRRERDFHIENATGEDSVPWEIEVGTRTRTVRVENQDIERAITEAVEKADQIESEAFKETEAKRTAALAKLTPEEAKLLGLR